MFNSHVLNMMFFTYYLCFVIIWHNVSPNLSCSITKSLIPCDKWVANANLSPILKSPWTCRPSWLTWFYWMKHNFDACLNKYNVSMVYLVIDLFFIEAPHFFMEYCLSLWPITNGTIFPLMSNFFGVLLWFSVMSLTTSVKSWGPNWHWYLQIAMSTNWMLPMNINCITK